MTRRILPFLLLAIPLTAHADLRAELQAKYSQLDRAVAGKQTAAVSRWIKANTTSDFVYGSHDKNLYTRPKFEAMLLDQVRMTRKVIRMSSKAANVKASGNKATVGLDVDTSLILNIDGQAMKLVDKSHTVDDWVRVGKEWRLHKSIQTKADTHMSK